MTIPSDQPGWRPDPERPGMVRWWNGLGWSDARRTADASIERVRDAAQSALRGSTITAQEVAEINAARSRLRAGATSAVDGAIAAANPFAAAAVAVSVLGFVLGLYGVLPLIGLVLALAGLVRSRRLAANGVRRTGLGRSVASLVVAVLGLLRWVPVLLAVPQVRDLLNG